MDGNTQIQLDAPKKTSRMLGTLRNSGRLKSPLSPQAGSFKNQSPSTPDKMSHSPGVTSPLSSVAALFRTKDLDDQSQEDKPVVRSRTEPNMPRLDSILKKGAAIRRSLRFSSKKDKRQDAVQEAEEEGQAEEEKEEEAEESWAKIEETYTLAELPHIPLSVMQINKLIEMEVLEEAHLHLLALRGEFERERLRLTQEDSPVELAKKEKDLSLLYSNLRLKMASIVRTSVSLPARNAGLLVHVARIIQEEDKRAREPGGLQGSWMDAWREAVDQGAQDKVEGVHLESTNHSNASWLAVHLGLLGTAVVNDLEKVKKELCRCYPPSFQVFATYVRSYHAAVCRHLCTLETRATLLRDLYALLDWILHRYRSERILGSLTLQPEMSDIDANMDLDDNFLLRLRQKFCDTVKVDMRAFLDRLVELENEELWSVRKRPDMDDDHMFTSDFSMDICTKVRGNVVNASRLNAELEGEVTASCLGQLKDFPMRFDNEFRRCCSSMRADEPLWSEYCISYVNSFSALQRHLEDEYAECSPLAVEEVDKEVQRVILGLLESVQEQFKDDVKPFLRRMMTRKWLTNDDDFKGLAARTEILAQHCQAMRQPHRQMASRAHYHVVKEYVGQLMKNNFSCKNRQHDKAASKIRTQSSRLADVFRQMGSREEWLDPVGECLSDIVGQKNKGDIKDQLQPLLQQYSDFSSKHLAAVLAFRGVMRGREHQRILLRLNQLKKTTPSGEPDDRDRALFRDMEATVRTDFLSDLSFFCFTFILPAD
ncbi:exocyst complex component 3-like protein 4 isoform X2 [Corythoichthys intestinalis]|uniref:exocyst complex component 3-like protein 4 isoform X2 n=1 Tax=Corythoichthys intestinalis TaxID=161448 RepID=UPI0025A4FFE0|nr:exocyst complex component 3-like protein 4 isoform X2 [Corythoichthys intestinalis]